MDNDFLMKFFWITWINLMILQGYVKLAGY